MAISLLLGWPAMLVVLASLIGALPRPLVGLDVLRQVARTLELLVAQRALMNLRLGVLLAPCHRPEDVILIDIDLRHWTLCRRGGELLGREDVVGSDTYSLSVLVTD